MSKPSNEFSVGYSIIDPGDPYEVRTGPFYKPDEDDGDPRLCFRVEEKHLNRSGVVHGGLLMSFADTTLCAASVADMDEERTITISMNVEFISAGELGDLVEGRAEITRRTGSLVFVRGTITSGEKILLTASAVIKRQRRNPLTE